MALHQLANQVWVYPPSAESRAVQPNVGVVIGPDMTILIDAGNSLHHARQIQMALEAQNAPPVRYLIYTHHHWDHCLGAPLWEGSVVIAQQQCRDLLIERYGELFKSHLSLEDHIRNDPAREGALRAIEATNGGLRGLSLVLPQISFSEDLSLRLNGLSLRLRHVGGPHAPDSITVLVEETGVMFLGDCCYPAPGTAEVDRGLVSALLAQEAAIYVEGHHQPMTHAAFAQAFESD